MVHGSLIDEAAKQRIKILEQELAESRSLIAGLKADLKVAIRRGFTTKVGVADELSTYEIDLVYNAYTAGFKKGSTGVINIDPPRRVYLDTLIYNTKRGIK